MTLYPRYIMIHHSLTKDSQTVSWGAIRDYHTKELGWQDIGYHYGVELVGDNYEILKGRTLLERGAHCKEENMNELAVGICVVGNYDLTPPPNLALLKLLDLIRELRYLYRIPTERIVAHRDYAKYKSCPGTLWPMVALKELV